MNGRSSRMILLCVNGYDPHDGADLNFFHSFYCFAEIADHLEGLG